MAVLTRALADDAAQYLNEYAAIIVDVCDSSRGRWACAECVGIVCKNHEDYMKIQRTIRGLRAAAFPASINLNAE